MIAAIYYEFTYEIYDGLIQFIQTSLRKNINKIFLRHIEKRSKRLEILKSLIFIFMNLGIKKKE